VGFGGRWARQRGKKGFEEEMGDRAGGLKIP